MDKSEYVNLLITNITNLCAKKNISPNQLGIKSGTGKDIIANLQKGSIISSDKLAKIADYLNCSVDYLLGRTDEPQGITQINTGDVGNNSSVNINKNNSDDELVSLISSLSLLDRSKVVLFIDELKQNEKES